MGNTIREARKKAGYTQEEIAKTLGVTQAAVNQWESGATRPRLEHIKKLSDILKIPVTELIQ